MSLVATAIAGGIGRLRLTRPEQRNALNRALVDEAVAGMQRLAAAGVTVAVLEAEPPVFCAGNDLAEMDDPATGPAMDLVRALVDGPLFWIAAVSGPALGAGVAMAAVCPVAVAAESAWFALPEHRHGLFPGGMVPFLEVVVGPRPAMRAALTGDPLSARDAATLGLVDEVVPDAGLPERTQEWGERLIAQAAVTDAARDAWQAQFRTEAFAGRLEHLLSLLGDRPR